MTASTPERGERGQTGDIGAQGGAGERGQAGDTGARGLDGSTGERGLSGDIGQTGYPGERGPTGDHGQAGDIGVTGVQGETGHDGPKGERGDTGQTGPRAEPRWFHLTDRRLLIFFVLLILAGVLIIQSYAKQQNELEATLAQVQTNTQAIQREVYEACLGRVLISEQFNTLLDEQRRIEKLDPTDTKTRAKIAAYKGAKVIIPICDAKNPVRQ